LGKLLRYTSRLALIGLLLAAVAACWLGWAYTHPPKRPLRTTPSSLGLAYTNVAFKSLSDDLTLRGWLVKPAQPEKRIVIFTHGYTENRENAQVGLRLAGELYGRQIASLLFDFRASGESEGEMTTIGADEQQDLLGAIRYVKDLGYEEIGVVGFSMGASTALSIAPDVPEVRAVIADSAFSDLERYLTVSLPEWKQFPERTVLPQLVVWGARLLMGIEPEKVQPIESVRRLRDQGLFLIHSQGDRVVPAAESERLREASGSSNTMLWISEANGHVGTYNRLPDQYLTRTTAFLDYYLSRGLFAGR